MPTFGDISLYFYVIAYRIWGTLFVSYSLSDNVSTDSSGTSVTSHCTSCALLLGACARAHLCVCVCVCVCGLCVCECVCGGGGGWMGV